VGRSYWRGRTTTSARRPLTPQGGSVPAEPTLPDHRRTAVRSLDAEDEEDLPPQEVFINAIAIRQKGIYMVSTDSICDNLSYSELDILRFMFAIGKFTTIEECWPWNRPLDNGYGRFPHKGRTKLAHRAAWEIWFGNIPEGLHIDHLCRNRSCVNPHHMEPVSIAENVLRGEGTSANNARKTHCLKGHPLSGENLYLYKGSRNGKAHRACISCMRSRTTQWRLRSKGEN
jgi:hypothetical protein